MKKVTHTRREREIEISDYDRVMMQQEAEEAERYLALRPLFETILKHWDLDYYDRRLRMRRAAKVYVGGGKPAEPEPWRFMSNRALKYEIAECLRAAGHQFLQTELVTLCHSIGEWQDYQHNEMLRLKRRERENEERRAAGLPERPLREVPAEMLESALADVISLDDTSDPQERRDWSDFSHLRRYPRR